MTIARTICIGFLAVIAIGTLLLMLPFATQDGNWNNPLVALFTATSAVCVTGLIVVDTGSYFSFWGQLIILLLITIWFIPLCKRVHSPMVDSIPQGGFKPGAMVHSLFRMSIR